jgi:hypothetical protein
MLISSSEAHYAGTSKNVVHSATVTVEVFFSIT